MLDLVAHEVERKHTMARVESAVHGSGPIERSQQTGWQSTGQRAMAVSLQRWLAVLASRPAFASRRCRWQCHRYIPGIFLHQMRKESGRGLSWIIQCPTWLDTDWTIFPVKSVGRRARPTLAWIRVLLVLLSNFAKLFRWHHYLISSKLSRNLLKFHSRKKGAG